MSDALERTRLHDHLINYDAEHAPPPEGRAGQVLALAVGLLEDPTVPIPNIKEGRP